MSFRCCDLVVAMRGDALCTALDVIAHSRRLIPARFFFLMVSSVCTSGPRPRASSARSARTSRRRFAARTSTRPRLLRKLSQESFFLEEIQPEHTAKFGGGFKACFCAKPIVYFLLKSETFHFLSSLAHSFFFSPLFSLFVHGALQ